MSDESSSREPRSSVIIRALVEQMAGQEPIASAERRVRNLSRSGACIDHDGDLAKGMTLRITMGSIAPFDAEVMWVNARLAGLRFARPVELEQARQPRGSAHLRSSAGWVTDVANPYRRPG